MSKAAFVAAVAALIIAVVYIEFRISSLPGPTAAPVAPPDTSGLEARLDRIEDLLTRVPVAQIPDRPDLPDAPATTISPSSILAPLIARIETRSVSNVLS